MKHKDGSIRGSFFHTTELPLSERERIEIVRVGERRRVVLCGVKRILQYGEKEMTFRLRGECVAIAGEGLSCTFYADGAVGVMGKVYSLRFLRDAEVGE